MTKTTTTATTRKMTSDNMLGSASEIGRCNLQATKGDCNHHDHDIDINFQELKWLISLGDRPTNECNRPTDNLSSPLASKLENHRLTLTKPSTAVALTSGQFENWSKINEGNQNRIYLKSLEVEQQTTTRLQLPKRLQQHSPRKCSRSSYCFNSIHRSVASLPLFYAHCSTATTGTANISAANSIEAEFNPIAKYSPRPARAGPSGARLLVNRLAG